jgi:hypothetical protein
MSFKSLSVVALVASALLVCAAGQARAGDINADLFFETNGLDTSYWVDSGLGTWTWGRYYANGWDPTGASPVLGDPSFRVNFGRYFIDQNTKNPIAGSNGVPTAYGTNLNAMQLRSSDVWHAMNAIDQSANPILNPEGTDLLYWNGVGVTSKLAGLDPSRKSVGLMTGGEYIDYWFSIGEVDRTNWDPEHPDDWPTMGYFPELKSDPGGLLGAGHPFGRNAIIGMYTVVGDAYLAGTFTSDDYSAYFNKLTDPGAYPTTWAYGDFNHDGLFNGDDYNLWFNAILNASGSGTALSAGAQVPEPATWSLVAVGLIVLLASRRWRKR